MWWDDGHWGVGQWIGMTLGMLLFWGLVVLFVYWLIRAVRNDVRRASSTPDRILAERYARGKTDAEEYAKRRAVLHGQKLSAPQASQPPPMRAFRRRSGCRPVTGSRCAAAR